MDKNNCIKKYWLFEIEKDSILYQDCIIVNKTFRYKYAYDLNHGQVIICIPYMKNDQDKRIFTLFPFKEIWIHPEEIIGMRMKDDETVVCTMDETLIVSLMNHFSGIIDY